MQLSTRLPYSAEALSAFIASYHQSIWPVQAMAVLLIALVIYALFRPFSQSSRLIGLTLTLFWLWTGYVFYIREFSTLSFLAPFYGTVFLLQAGLLFWFVVVRSKLDIRFDNNCSGWTGIILLFFALIFYPLIVILFEGRWTSYRLAGVTPMASVLFTLGMTMQMQAGKVIRYSVSMIPAILLIIYGISGWFLF
jgi:hypothetical protein